jgi:hypothetical protein
MRILFCLGRYPLALFFQVIVVGLAGIRLVSSIAVKNVDMAHHKYTTSITDTYTQAPGCLDPMKRHDEFLFFPRDRRSMNHVVSRMHKMDVLHLLDKGSHALSPSMNLSRITLIFPQWGRVFPYVFSYCVH